MNRLRKQRGQAMVLTVLFSTGMLGMAALVLDLGSWMRAQRDLQAIADAAALAGAQALPDTGAANALAVEFTNKNTNLAVSRQVTFPAADTIRVRIQRDAPGVFARLFSIDAVNVEADASARSQNPSEARWAAPIGVDRAHPMLNGCSGLPCFNQDTQLDLEKVGPGAFRLLNIDGSHGGTGQKPLAEWIRTGFDGWMGLGQYFSDPGAKFNAKDIEAALEDRFGTEMLFPIYRTIREEGANLEYEVVGWVGFVPTSVNLKGNGGVVFGHFTRVVWEGLQGQAGNPDYGVRSIELVE
jgi:hypothetical protein